MNMLDRALGLIAPGAALRRAEARLRLAALGGYYGPTGRYGNRVMRGWITRGGSADADLVPDLQNLRQDSRDLSRRTALARAAINRTVTSVIGPGLRLIPQIDREILGLDDATAEAWERKTEREWALWAGRPEASANRFQAFYELQATVFRAVLESGDVFVLPRRIVRPGRVYNLALQLFEADQINTPVNVDGALGNKGPRIVDGIELDADGAPIAVYIQKRHPGDLSVAAAAPAYNRIPMFTESGRLQVKHLAKRLRPNQTRGEPMLAPVLADLRQLTRYSEAELFAAVIAAMFAVTYKSPTGNTLQSTNPDENQESDDESFKVLPPNFSLEAGTVLELPAPDSIEVPKLGRPNSDFDNFFTAVVRQIGAALEIPFEVLIQHFTASYSASRAALEQAWLFFRQWRNWMADDFTQWVYEEFLLEAVARNRIAAPGFFADPIVRQAWSGGEWIGPARISLDPKKENDADAIAEDRGWKTSREITREKTGGDWEKKHRQRAREVARRRADGLEGAPTPAGTSEPNPDPGVADRPEDETQTEN